MLLSVIIPGMLGIDIVIDLKFFAIPSLGNGSK